MRDWEEATSQRVAFLECGFALVCKDGIHINILVKPESGPPISACKAILAATTEVFRHVLSTNDPCKAPAGDSISLADLSHDDLSVFLGFLYTGALDDEHLLSEQRLHALLVAGDMYDVPFLRQTCEARLTARVEPGNALWMLEVAEQTRSAALRERAMNIVVEHAERVMFSLEYEEFVATNASLSVEVQRATLLPRSVSAHSAEASASSSFRASELHWERALSNVEVNANPGRVHATRFLDIGEEEEEAILSFEEGQGQLRQEHENLGSGCAAHATRFTPPPWEDSIGEHPGAVQVTRFSPVNPPFHYTRGHTSSTGENRARQRSLTGLFRRGSRG